MSNLKKPICFSYRQYVDIREAYKALLADNQKLAADNKQLRDRIANLEIRCRIAEADNSK